MSPKRPSKVSCSCARKCFERLSETTRKELFDGFWRTANFDVQNAFLCGCVKVFETKRKYTRVLTHRGIFRGYFISKMVRSQSVFVRPLFCQFLVSLMADWDGHYHPRQLLVVCLIKTSVVITSLPTRHLRRKLSQ